MINFGIGGFQAKLRQSLHVGEKININLILSEQNKQESLSGTARVVWSCEEDNCFKYGFKFINMDEKKKNILKNHLDCFSQTNY